MIGCSSCDLELLVGFALEVEQEVLDLHVQVSMIQRAVLLKIL